MRDGSSPCDHWRLAGPTHRLGGGQRAGGVIQLLGASELPGTGEHEVELFCDPRRGVNSRVVWCEIMHAMDIAATGGLHTVRVDPPEPSSAPVTRAGALERHTRARTQKRCKRVAVFRC